MQTTRQADRSQQHADKRVAKLLAIAGIREAIRLVREHAWTRSCEDVISMPSAGEDGEYREKLMHYIDTGDDPDGFARAFFADSIAEWEEDLAPYAAEKIAGLWGLSASQTLRLSNLMAMHFVSPEALQLIWTGRTTPHAFSNTAVASLAPKTKANRLYLDVTELTNDEIRTACHTIARFRRELGISAPGTKPGRPRGVDTQRALQVASLARAGVPLKKIAVDHGFKVYTTDNPSGSYPLARKYLNLGKKLSELLDLLDDYLTYLEIG